MAEQPLYNRLKLLFPQQDWLNSLDQFHLHAAKRSKGMMAGKRTSSHLGSSLEFADYRPYIPGDDTRRIDWNLYARTAKAYIRQYWDEQERHFHLYIDCSRSMTLFGEQEQNKWLFAMRVAASIGYVALNGEDRLSINLYNEQAVTHQLPMLYGKAAKFTFLDRVSEWISDMQGSLEQKDSDQVSVPASDAWIPFARLTHLPRKAGVTWIFSDGLYEQGLDELLLHLQARNQQVVFVHILHQDELEPEREGEWRYIDIETSIAKEVAMSPVVYERYKKGVALFQEQIKQKCEARGISYYRLNSSNHYQDQFYELLANGIEVRMR